MGPRADSVYAHVPRSARNWRPAPFHRRLSARRTSRANSKAGRAGAPAGGSPAGGPALWAGDSGLPML